MSESDGQLPQEKRVVLDGKPGEPVMPLNLSSLDEAQQSKQMPVKMHHFRRHTLDTMLDVPVTLVFEVGRTEITIKELLELTNGSLVDLRNVSVDTIDVRINEVIVAHSETIAMKQGYGVRFGEIINLSKTDDEDD